MIYSYLSHKPFYHPHIFGFEIHVAVRSCCLHQILQKVKKNIYENDGDGACYDYKGVNLIVVSSNIISGYTKYVTLNLCA